MTDSEQNNILFDTVWNNLEKILPRARHVLSHVPILLASGMVEVNVDGGFGVILRGYVGTRLVAMKTPRAFLGDDQKRNRWILREADLWCQLQHQHILEFMGIYAEEGRVYVITPWCSNGNCLDYMRSNPAVDRIRLLIQVAEAMLYLHTFSPVIVHGDIKGENVLINDSGDALLCDFGYSRLEVRPIGATVTTTQLAAAGTWPFMAPELFRHDDDEEESDGHEQNNREILQEVLGDEQKNDRKWSKTSRSDVYAFGCLIFQIMTEKRPFSNLRDPVKILFKVVQGERPKRPMSFHNDRLWKLSNECWEYNPDDRPIASNILTALQNIHQGGLQAANRLTERDAPDALGASDRPSTTDMNHRIPCRNCNVMIVGLRYQCATCPSLPTTYNLCANCEARSYLLHDLMHVFFKIPRPVDRAIESPFGFLPILYRQPCGTTADGSRPPPGSDPDNT